MNYPWSKSVFPIAAIFSFRMLGLFMLIPIFTLYATHLEGATPTSMGVALGAYGLSQGLLQIPFGILSDRHGRKTLITIGLVLFALGSLLGALTHTIYGMIFARMLQGTGAVGSVLIALLADLTPNEQRTKAMAVIGATIGASFSLAMVLSPAIATAYGLSGIFYFTVILSLSGLFLLHAVIPTPERELRLQQKESHISLLKKALFDPQLQKLNIGIFLQHAILTSTFFVVPLILHQHHLEGHLVKQWHFYLPVILISFLLMVPCIILSERKHLVKEMFLTSILITSLTQCLLAFYNQYWIGLCVIMLVYFVGFNILEASLPSLISKQAKENNKGTAMGVYSSCQFLGIFAGGALSGLIFQSYDITGVFITNTILGILWFAVTRSIRI